MKFKVRDGFTLFRGEHAHDMAFAHAAIPGGYRGPGAYGGGATVELTGGDFSLLNDRQRGMLEALDDEARAALADIEPTVAPAATAPSPGLSGGVFDLWSRGQQLDRPCDRIPANPVGIIWRAP